MKVIIKCVNIKLCDILGCFQYILNAPRCLHVHVFVLFCVFSTQVEDIGQVGCVHNTYYPEGPYYECRLSHSIIFFLNSSQFFSSVKL